MHITKDSREVKTGSIYFCFVGEALDGHDFITTALENGASKIIGTKEIDGIQNYEKVDDVELEFSKYSQEVNDFKNVDLKYVAVTGTDGKTSTTLIIDQILNKLSTSSYLGTSGFYINDEEISYTGMTTLFADEMYKNIKLANDKSDYFVMEVSSHALKQKRIAGLKYDVAIFTNFTNDHLDYHKTLEDYFNSKLLITDYIKDDGYLLINEDIDKLDYIKSKVKNVLTFGQNGDIKISNVELNINKTKFDLTYNDKTYEINSKLLANFNTYNLATAIVCVNLLGFKMEEILKVINDIKVAGRLMYIENETLPDVILDFAHTPDAILKVMEFINSQKNGKKVHVIMGSAGGRDHSKRPEMGENVSKYADKLTLSTDDPRFENVVEISNEIISGITNKNCQVDIEVDRKKAIRNALLENSKDDIVVLLGKTGQKYMYIEDYKIEYDETQIVNELIEELK